MAKHGKSYVESRSRVDREREYGPAEAVRLIKETKRAKFDETVEAHFRLGLNVRHADQQLRGTLMLPHGTGKSVRVAVFAEGDKAREAEEAGADVVGAADLAAKIEGGFTDFDVAIATPDQMGVVGRLGRILGPQGKMPNPKVGTVTMDVRKAVEESKSGKVEYRTDRTAIVHLVIGTGGFGLPSLVALRKHRHGDVAPETMRQDEGPANLLVGMAHVDPEPDVDLDRLSELGGLHRPDGLHRLCRRVLPRAVDLLAQAAIALSPLHATSTPIDRAVPSMIFIAWSTSWALRSGSFVSAISRTWSREMVPTFSRFGSPDPFSIPIAWRISTAAGGVFVMKVNERSS